LVILPLTVSKPTRQLALFCNRISLGLVVWILGSLSLIDPLSGMQSTVSIRSLNTEDGLSSHNISSVMQDDLGYLWIGTDDGLNRYDGVNFQVYRNDPGDTLTISDTRVTTLLANTYAGQPELWVGTRQGLNRVDLKTGLIIRYLSDPADSTSLSNPIITALAMDSLGLLWVGTANGLNLLSPEDRQDGEFLRFMGGATDSLPTTPQLIRSLAVSQIGSLQHVLWIGTSRGLKRINYSDDTDHRIAGYNFSYLRALPIENDIRALEVGNRGADHFLYIGTEAGALYKANLRFLDQQPISMYRFDSYIRDIHLDGYNRVWVATYGRGVYSFMDRDNQVAELENFTGDPDRKHQLSNSHTSDLYPDKSGIIWVGTDNGLNKLIEPMHGFKVYTHVPGNDQSLIGSGIRSVLPDQQGVLWVGTVANGLSRVDRLRGVYKHYVHDPNDPASLSVNSVTALLRDRQDRLWLGTWEGGLLRMNADEQGFTSYFHQVDDPASIPSNVIQGILEDGQGRLWLNTAAGLSRFNEATNNFINYLPNPDDSSSISAGDLQSKALVLDRNNYLWIGSYGGGLNRLDLSNPQNLDPKTARFDHFNHDPGNDQSISSDLVISLKATHDQTADVIWVGTFNAGLTRLEYQRVQGQETTHFSHFTEANGLCDNVIFGIEEDQQQNLWLSTGEGLAYFNLKRQQFTAFYVEDGLPANSFFWGASGQAASGELFFGGTDGLVSFYPDGITRGYLFTPKISITGVKLMNEPLCTRPRDFGDTRLYIDKHRELITINWALFDFKNPLKNRYKYQLEGLQDDWVPAENRTTATFSNLTGGNYTFRVKGFNYNGVESEREAVLKFRVKPPIWQTTVFKVVLVALVLLIIYLIITIRTRVIKARNKQLTEINEELNLLIKKRVLAEEALRHSLDEKEVLLREIYHRTKNNMTVIISLLNLQAVSIDDPKITEMFEEIKGRIFAMALVHEQLMRAEDLSVIDLNDYVRQLVSNLFQSFPAVSKRINCRVNIQQVEVSIDTAVPLGLVLNEIITNSLKYAFPDHREGAIDIDGHLADEQLIIRVADDGIGFTKHAEEQAESVSLGTRIIKIVVEDQLAGEITRTNAEGTVYEIVLKDVKIIRRV